MDPRISAVLITGRTGRLHHLHPRPQPVPAQHPVAHRADDALAFPEAQIHLQARRADLFRRTCPSCRARASTRWCCAASSWRSRRRAIRHSATPGIGDENKASLAQKQKSGARPLHRLHLFRKASPHDAAHDCKPERLGWRRTANLAPSVHNTQPTRWRLDDDGTLSDSLGTPRVVCRIGDPGLRDAGLCGGAALGSDGSSASRPRDRDGGDRDILWGSGAASPVRCPRRPRG